MINVKYIEPKKLACPQEIVVTFRYKQEIVNVIRTIPDRFWDAKNKEWHLSYDSLPVLKEALPNEEFNIVGTPIDNKKYGEKIIEKHFDLPKGLKTQLYPFQEEGFNEMMNFDKFLLLFEQGLGKTCVSIAVALKRKELNNVKHCLVVCGINLLKYTWSNEIYKHAGLGALILGNRKNKNGKWSTGSTKDKLDDLNNLNEFFVITNVESLRNKDIKEKLKTLIDKHEIDMIIFDELQACKSPSSQQGKALQLLATHVKYFYGLTGTVISNSPLDLYNPLKFVGREVANFTNYKYRYVEYGGWGNFSIVGYKHLDELQLKLHEVSLRKTKKDVLDLPPKIYIDEYVDMGTKQAKLYSDVLKTIMDDIDNVMLSPDPLSQMVRLRQVTDFPSIISSTIEESSKMVRLKEIVEEVVSNNGKLLVFSNWTSVTDIIYQELSKYNPAIITGKIKDRETQKNKFMEDDSCKVLIGTIAAMSTGLTLTAANTVVFMDEPWTAASKSQAEDRAHRIGTNSSINIITLMCKDTIDEHIHKVVKKKQLTSDAIVDKKYDLKNKDILQFIMTGDGDIDG